MRRMLRVEPSDSAEMAAASKAAVSTTAAEEATTLSFSQTPRDWARGCQPDREDHVPSSTARSRSLSLLNLAFDHDDGRDADEVKYAEAVASHAATRAAARLECDVTALASEAAEAALQAARNAVAVAKEVAAVAADEASAKAALASSAAVALEAAAAIAATAAAAALKATSFWTFLDECDAMIAEVDACFE